MLGQKKVREEACWGDLNGRCIMVCGNCTAWELNCRDIGYEKFYEEVVEKEIILLKVKPFGNYIPGICNNKQ